MLKTPHSFLTSGTRAHSDARVKLSAGRKPSFSEVQIIMCDFYKLSERLTEIIQIKAIK